jgi:hypothetical protein
MKKLLIITGPQGSGNHLFSRILSLHPDVGGWKDLLDEYWIPSDLEPFAEYWVNPGKLTLEAFEGAEYWLANVSVPFVYDGVKQVPKIDAMASKARALGIDVQICVIVRDQYVNALQQQRVRKETTLSIAVDYFDTLGDVHYLDHEAFFLYKDRYLKWLSKILDFPIAYDDPNIMKFIEEGPNKKYVNNVEEHWLDEQVWQGIQPKKARGL